MQGKNEEAVGLTSSSILAGRDPGSGDEVSFILNLYPDGYSIVKTSENDNTQHPTFQDGLKHLRPYDRTSEGLFAVRDYRKCISDPGPDISSSNESGTINKVFLKMSLENVVKDISVMADDSWTYGNLMEVESRILNALQPKLCLDPVPRLDRLCENPASLKVNLGLAGARKRRLRQIPEVTVTSNNRQNGKKICIAQPPSSSYGDVMSQHVQDNMYAQGQANQRTQRTMHDPLQGHNLPPGASLAFQDMPSSYAENMNSTATAKVVSQEGQLSPYSNFNKRAGLGPGGQGSSMDGFQGSEVQWRNQMLHHQQNARGAQYPQLVGEGMATQDGVKLEKAEPNMLKTDVHMEAEGSQMDQRVQQRFPNHLMRPAYNQPGWNNLSQQMEKQNLKEEQFSKRKPIQSPRLSAGAVAQSPLSARSTDISCGSPASLGQVLREKSGVGPVKGAGRASSVTSSANDSMQQLQHQAQGAAKRRTNSLPKNPAISGVGSPVSVNTMGGGPMNVTNPSISSPQLTDRNMLERFAKIEVVAMRHQLNCKKNKVDEFPRKPRAFSARGLLGCLSGVSNNEYVDDSREMSKSLVGGHVNVCKIRVVNLQPAMQGNMLPAPVRTRMILSEKPNDGTVAMHYGDLSDGDYLNAEDYLPTLPNTQWADLLAAQFCTLVIREGYVIEEVVQPRPPRSNAPSNSQPNASGGTPNNSTVDTQQYSEPIESKPTVSNSLNSTAGMHPPGNSQIPPENSQMSGVTMPARPQQMDPQQPLQQHLPHQQSQIQNQPSMMQQVQPQFQRSPLMQPNNSMPPLNAFGPGSNLPMGNQMGYKPSPSLQMLQQPGQQTQSQSQSAQMQRRMMMGLGTGMGMGNNMGLGGLSNVMGMGGAKAAVGPMSGMGGNMGQNPMALSQANVISQHLRAGTLNPQALVAAQKLKILQNRGMLPGTQSGIPGMPGAAGRQMQPGAGGLSMLSQSLNRGNMGQMQRTGMGQMGMPNLMPGINAPFNQQQLQQLQQMQQQQQQQQSQPRQHALPQQESTSPLQSVLSPQQVSSSSTMGVPQQMNQQFTPQQQASPQQIGQRAPVGPPLSSGPVHPMSAGNPEGCPASPALSSQTLGSVGSITNTNGLAGSE
ncbi:hypothetical protein KSS87_000089 [Heliosperma pusillum]|nr:hypothetical protein KSS87_000089 [Heliosperma pusillum]